MHFSFVSKRQRYCGLLVLWNVYLDSRWLLDKGRGLACTKWMGWWNLLFCLVSFCFSITHSQRGFGCGWLNCFLISTHFWQWEIGSSGLLMTDGIGHLLAWKTFGVVCLGGRRHKNYTFRLRVSSVLALRFFSFFYWQAGRSLLKNGIAWKGTGLGDYFDEWDGGRARKKWRREGKEWIQHAFAELVCFSFCLSRPSLARFSG